MDSPPTVRRLRPAGHALIAAVIALLLASLLNAHSLADVAERQPPGFVRTVATSLTGAAVRVASTLWLDRPRLALDALVGREQAETVTRPPPRSTPAPGGAPEVDLSPSANDPARAWIIGDSMMELVGPKLSDELAASGVIDPEVDFRFITGLSRPDVFDWPSHVAARMRQAPPDLIVAMFGGNDGQPVSIDGRTYVEFTPAWWDLYRRRVAETMDAMRGDRIAYWVGLPVMKDPEFSQHAREMNVVYREEAEARPWMRYIASWDVFTDEAGRYADYLPNLNGDLRLMRYADGAHFTPSGALELALHLEDAIASEWRIPSG